MADPNPFANDVQTIVEKLVREGTHHDAIRAIRICFQADPMLATQWLDVAIETMGARRLADKAWEETFRIHGIE